MSAVLLGHRLHTQWILDDAVQTCNECRSHLKGISGARQANEEDPDDVKYGQRLLPKTGRLIELQPQLRNSKCTNDGRRKLKKFVDTLASSDRMSRLQS